MVMHLGRDRTGSSKERSGVGLGPRWAKVRANSSASHAHVEWLPAEPKAMHVIRTIRRSVADVETVLRVGPERAIELAYGKQAGTSGVVVPLGGIGWLSVPAHVESLTPSVDHHSAVISIRWRARRGPRYFPVMEADLGARTGADGTTLLVLDGRYRPPLGLLGLIFDRILGRRIASATAANFVDRIANVIEPHDSREST